MFTGSIVGAVLLATVARNAVHGAWGVPFAVLRWTVAIAFLYVSAIVLLVGIELDVLLCQNLRGEQQRGILEIVRDVL